MKYGLTVLQPAKEDIDQIRRWLAGYSPAGASSWYGILDETVRALKNDPEQSELAPESRDFGREIRHRLFKTRRGKPYRVVYTIVGNQIRVLLVRGPGQAPLTTEDVSE